MKRILICFIVSIMLFMEGILPVQASQGQKEPLEISGLVYDHSMELDYAEQFSVDYYKDGYALITIADKDRFLVVPEGKKAPESLDETNCSYSTAGAEYLPCGNLCHESVLRAGRA